MSENIAENTEPPSPIQEKFTCACGGRYTWNNKSRHYKTHLHKKYEAKLEEQQSESEYKSDSEYGGFDSAYMEEYDYLFYNGD